MRMPDGERKALTAAHAWMSAQKLHQAVQAASRAPW